MTYDEDLQGAVREGIITQDEADLIDALLKAWPSYREHFAVGWSRQRFQANEEQAKAHGLRPGQRPRVLGALVPEKIGEMLTDARHVAVLFEGSDIGTFAHEFAEFAHRRLLKDEERGLVKKAHKGSKSRKSQNEWFSDTFTQWWLGGATRKQKPVPEGLEGLFQRVLQAVKGLYRRISGRGRLDARLRVLFDDIVLGKKDIVNRKQYWTKEEATQRYFLGAETRPSKMTVQGFSGNAKTFMNWDPGTSCPRLQPLQDLARAKLAKGELKLEDLSRIEVLGDLHDEARNLGLPVPCSYCYVEGARRRALRLFNEGAEWPASRIRSIAMAKVVFDEVEYKSAIKSWKKKRIKDINKRGGLRLFSFSDYDGTEYQARQITRLLDDAKARGLGIKAITKNPQFIEDFGDRNITINVSIDSDANGGDGMSHRQAAGLKKRFPKSVKIRSVAMNLAEVQYFAEMKDKFGIKGWLVDVITPYHHELEGPLPEGAWNVYHVGRHSSADARILESFMVDRPDLELDQRTCCMVGGKCFSETHDEQCGANCGLIAGNLSVPAQLDLPRRPVGVLENPFVEGAPSGEKVGEVNQWLLENRDGVVRFYHGTGRGIPVLGQGLKPTSAKRRRSYQSQSGYVYLANTPARAKAFGDLGNQSRSVVYAVDVPVKDIRADIDQVNNQRAVGEKVGNSVAESIVYGGGVRIKGPIPAHAINLWYPKVEITGEVQHIRRGERFDIHDIDNARFMLDPDTGDLVLGTGDIDHLTHAQEFHQAGFPPARYDDFIRGWVGASKRGYPDGVIHFAPPVSWPEHGEYPTEDARRGLATLKYFLANGATKDTAVRNLGKTGHDRKLGESFPEALEGETMFQVQAWHGGPHGFDKFRTDAIGTGEGAQAFGWGLYFTAEEDIANHYANIIQRNTFMYDGEETNSAQFREDIESQYGEKYGPMAGRIAWDFQNNYNADDIMRHVENWNDTEKGSAELAKEIVEGLERTTTQDVGRWRIRLKGGIRTENKMTSAEQTALFDIQGRAGWYRKDIDALKNVREEFEKTVAVQKKWIKAIESGEEKYDNLDDRIRARGEAQTALDVMNKYDLIATLPKPKRHKYKVTLHKGKSSDEYEWLEWDKAVDSNQKGLIENVFDDIVNRETDYHQASELSRRLGEKYNFDEKTGSDIYKEISSLLKSDKEASLSLLRAGIDGIRYPVGTISGAKRKAKHNYVVFDENAVEIEEHTRFQADDARPRAQRMAEALRSKPVMDILLAAPGIESGPFDGGCLVCAKALQVAIPGAKLASIVAENERGEAQAEHYGVKLPGGGYVDAGGYAATAEAWVNRFSKDEGLDRPARVEDRLAPSDEIPDDPATTKAIAQILMRRGTQLRTGEVSARDVRNLQDLARFVAQAFRRSGLSQEMIDRVNVDFRSVIEVRNKDIDRTVEEWKREGRSIDQILAATTLTHYGALVQLSLNQDLRTMEQTVYHEAFHLAARWVLPITDYAKLQRHFKTEEGMAEAYRKFVTARTQAAKSALPAPIRRILARIRRILEHLRSALIGKGWTTPGDIFGSILEGGLPAADVGGGRFEVGGGKEVGGGAEGVNEFAQPSNLSVGDAAQTIQGNPNFQKWFEGSQVVDEQGRPLVVYHGTKESFKEFKVGAPGSNSNLFGSWEVKRAAIFFSDEPDVAGDFAMQGEKPIGGGEGSPNIVPVHLAVFSPVNLRDGFSDALLNSLEERGLNPRYYYSLGPANIWEAFDDENGGRELVGALKDIGYDGALLVEPDPDGDMESLTWAAFDPEQIKSVFNQGTFDPTSPDIMLKGQEDPRQNESFLHWFEGSVATDTGEAGGAPKQVHHGTLNRFRKFERGDLGYHFGSEDQAYNRAAEQINLAHFMDENIGVAPGDGNEGATEDGPWDVLHDDELVSTHGSYGEAVDAKREHLHELFHEEGLGQADILPVYLAIKNPLRMGDVDAWGDFRIVYENMPEDVYEQADPDLASEMYGVYTEIESTEGVDASMHERGLALMREALEGLGYDGVIYGNKHEGGGDSYIAFRANQVKSIVNEGGWSRETGDMYLTGEPERAPVFHHRIVKVAEAKLREMPGKTQSLPKWLQRQGVKPAEMMWLDVDSWLKENTDKQGKFDKQAFLDYLKANQIEIREVVRDEEGADRADVQDRALDAAADLIGAALNDRRLLDSEADDALSAWAESGAGDDRAEAILDSRLAQTGLGLTAGDYYTTAIEDFEGSVQGATKYETYQLPGGEEYREMLFVLPSARGQVKFDPSKVEIRRDRRSVTQGSTAIYYDGELLANYGDDPELTPGGGYEQKPDSHWMQVAEEVFAKGDSRNRIQSKSGAYRSSHWDEPNVLAHVRFNERVDAEGNRVLFIEEVQSDWLQEAKEKGFTDVEAQRRVQREILGRYDLVPEDTGQWSVEVLQKAGVPNDLAQEWFKVVMQAPVGVPKAPFLENWPELMMKRMLRYAAENGFDRVAWARGKHQIDRYEEALRKSVDEIRWDKSLRIENLMEAVHELTDREKSSLEAYMAERREAEGLFADAPGAEGLLAAVSKGTVKRKDLGALKEWLDREGESIPRKSVVIRAFKDGDEKFNQVVRLKGFTTVIKKEVELKDIVGKPLARQIVASSQAEGTFQGDDLSIGGMGMRSFYDEMLPGAMAKYVKQWGATVGKTEIGSEAAHPETTFNEWLDMQPGQESDFDSEQDARRQYMEEYGVEAVETVHSLDITPEMRQSVLFEGQTWFQVAQRPTGRAAIAEARDLEKNRTFANRLWEMRDLGALRVGVEAAKLQEMVQGLTGKASKRKLRSPLGIAYRKDTKRSTASDQLDRAMMLARDLAGHPEKAGEFRAWAWARLRAEHVPARDKIRIRGQLKTLDQAEALDADQSAFVGAMGELFEDAFQLARTHGVIKSHREYYVRRIWRFAKGDRAAMEVVSGGAGSHAFKTAHGAADRRTLDTILDGWMAGYELAIEGITSSYENYMTELVTVLANRAFIARGMASRDISGNRLFTTSANVPGYAKLGASGLSAWQLVGTIGALDEQKLGGVLEVNSWGKRVFLTPPEEVAERWAVYAAKGAAAGGGRLEVGGRKGRPSKSFDSEAEARKWMAKSAPGGRIEHRPATETSEMFQKLPLYAPVPIAAAINKMTATDQLFSRAPGAVGLLRLNAGIKSWILMSSFFHHLAGSRSWVFGVKTGWRGINPVQAYKRGLDKVMDLHPLVEMGVKHGLTLGEIQDWSETALQANRGYSERLVNYLGLDVMGKAMGRGRHKREQWSNALFKKYFAGLKAEAFVVEYTHNLQTEQDLWQMGKRKAPPNPVRIAEQVAALINADFGGLHLKRMGRHPSLQKILRLLLLAPDWTESNWRTVLGMAPGLNDTIDKLAGGLPSPPGMNKVYRQFWGRVSVRLILYTVIPQLLLNGWDDTWEMWKEQFGGRFAKRRWTEVDISKMYDVLGVEREGKRKTFSVGGHFFDILRVMDLVGLAKGKGSPFARAIGAVGSGTNWADRPFTGVKELVTTGKTVKSSAYEGEEGMWDRLPSTLINQVVGMQPIQVGHFIAYLMGEEDGLTSLMTSAGAHVHTAWPPRITTPIIRIPGGQADPVYDEVARLRESEDLRMGPPSRWITLSRKPGEKKGERVKLTHEQYQWYLRQSGAYVRRRLKATVGSEGWRRMSDEDKAARIRSMVSNGRKKTRGRLRRSLKVLE